MHSARGTAGLLLFAASLFAQNQGSAIQVLGGPNPFGISLPSQQQVTITSFADDTIGGDTNNDVANTMPRGGKGNVQPGRIISPAVICRPLSGPTSTSFCSAGPLCPRR